MKLWVFDNDGTLYDDANAHDQFSALLIRYVASRLNCSEENASMFLEAEKQKADSGSLVGTLVQKFHFDFDELVNQTYLNIDLSECVPAPDQERRKVLENIPDPKIVLTNNPAAYAQKVLRRIGLDHCFVDVK